VATKNFEEIRGVLKSVHVDDDSIAGIVERIRRDA
jgi:hypothetical protein